MSITLDDEENLILGLDDTGRPDPGYAQSLGLVAASAGSRSLAFTIDAAIVLLLTLPLSLGTLPLWMGVFLTTSFTSPEALLRNDEFITGLVYYGIGQGLLWLFVFVQIIVHGLRGRTVGKAIVGIRSVKVSTFEKPGFWRMFLRGMIFWMALAIVPILGGIPFLLSPLWDREHRGRGWLDKIGHNWLIDVRRGLDPFDLKALRHARRKISAVAHSPQEELPSLATGAEGAVTSFVPASRSRSGVVSPPTFGSDQIEPWQPPPVGALVEPPNQPAQGTEAKVLLLFDDGTVIEVTGDGLIGRSPSGKADESFSTLIPLVDESMRISKTHLALGVDSVGFWLIDRGSSNGTPVSPPEGESFSLVPWERRYIPWNSVVEVGGRSFTVTGGSQMNGREA
ncbi:RDD family protein [Salinibacterium sp. SWN167]|uniref:RDD family protein n=1 Tax=Salinibacterium sp. SWN167 TaxID=2792054 RepID=UPI0018CCE728|nr:RDD family protein [Salinibacterium sp. SWN167]MBH0082966.1 RDD family protein [Salinibacterium sp. SWN167]